MYKLIFSILLLFINYSSFAHFTVVRILPILFFLFIIFSEIVLKKPTISFFNKNFSLLYVLALMLIVGILVSTRKDISLDMRVFRVISFASFIVAFFSTVLNLLNHNTIFSTFVKCVYVPLLVFISLNLALWAIGISSKDYNIGSAVLLSYLGITVDRVEFFLSPGINAYGSLLGILLNFSLIGIGIIKENRKLFIAGFSVSLISLFLTDSRGPIIFSLIIFLVIKFMLSKLQRPKILWIVPIIGFIGPILLMSALALLAQTSYGEVLSRSSEDLATGNSRLIIWTIAFSDFLTFKPEHHLFGYGEFGQYAAGLSQQWAYVFGDNEGAEFMHPHNMFLSTLLDYGYFGLLLLTAVQFLIVNVIIKEWNTHKEISYVLLANILYFNLVGITETMFGFYYQNVIYLFFMVNFFAFVIRYHNKKFKNQPLYVRSDKIHPIASTSRNRAPFKRGSVYPGLVQFPARQEK